MAENILQTIAAHARTRVAADRAKISLEELKALCQEAGPGQGEQFVSALNRPGLSFLCEIKKASLDYLSSKYHIDLKKKNDLD